MAEQTLFGALVLALTAFSAGAGLVLAVYGVSTVPDVRRTSAPR